VAASSGGCGGGGGGGGGGSTTTTTGTSTPRFSDVPLDHTFYEFIENLASDEVVGGYDDGTFRPDDFVTRGQMSKFIANGFGFTELDNSCGDFPDVSPGYTFYNQITTLKCKGVVAGYVDGTYRPEELVSRGQAMKFVISGARIARGDSTFLANTQDDIFPDVPRSNVFYEYVMSAYSNAIVNGYPDGNFGPEDPVNRGAMAKMVSNTRDLLN
jgi:hypothetical protein